MKTMNRSYAVFMRLTLAVVFLLGCKLVSGISIQPTAQPSSQGSSDELINPALGLDQLQSYHVSFQQDVIGSLDGQPYESHTHIELSRASGQVDFIREIEGTEDPTSFFHVISDGQAIYRWFNADQSCQGEAGKLADDEMLEPAALLFHLTGTTQMSSEILNQVATTHYQFNQNNLRISDPKPEIIGDLWIADQGGYVVKFKLTIAPPSNPSGVGMETGQEWTYEISQVNSIDSIQLPENCMPVPVEIPTPPDAQEITRNSGLVSFTTASQASTVVDFYLQNLPGLGWKTDQQKPTADLKLPASLSFDKGDQKLSVNIDKSNQGGLDVDILIYMHGARSESSSDATPVPGADSTPTPAPTAVSTESGLPDDIPLYPGVTDLATVNSMFTAKSTDPVSSVVNFYLEQMPALGWTLLQNFTSNGTTILMWQKQDRMVSITVGSPNGKTRIMIIQPKK